MAITQEEILKIKDAMKQAEESETPFPILKDGELAVVGDVNDIGKKKHDYTIKFRFPETWGVKGEKVGDYTITEVEYKDKFINPKRDFDIARELMNIEPFFNHLREDGSIEERTQEELAQVVFELNDEIVDSLYRIVATVLEIDDELACYMLPVSVFKAVADIISNNASAWNEADVFFG